MIVFICTHGCGVRVFGCLLFGARVLYLCWRACCVGMGVDVGMSAHTSVCVFVVFVRVWRLSVHVDACGRFVRRAAAAGGGAGAGAPGSVVAQAALPDVSDAHGMLKALR